MIALMFTMVTGWTNTYMVEVRLDNPIKNMLEGGEGLDTHGGNGSKCYAKHIDDPDWAVVHFKDDDWILNPGNEEKALERIDSYMEKYQTEIIE
jgi:hypothetical protein